MCHPREARTRRDAALSASRGCAAFGTGSTGSTRSRWTSRRSPRRAHVGRHLSRESPARLRRVAVQLPDDAADRARDGACYAGATSA